MREAKRLFFITSLISLFAVHQVNMLIFTHVHYVNGRTITHTHPNNGEHSHTNAEYICIYSLFSPFLVTSVISYVCSSQLFIYQINKINSIFLSKEIHLKIPSLRAPPFVKALHS